MVFDRTGNKKTLTRDARRAERAGEPDSIVTHTHTHIQYIYCTSSKISNQSYPSQWAFHGGIVHLSAGTKQGKVRPWFASENSKIAAGPDSQFVCCFEKGEIHSTGRSIAHTLPKSGKRLNCPIGSLLIWCRSVMLNAENRKGKTLDSYTP